MLPALYLPKIVHFEGGVQKIGARSLCCLNEKNISKE